MSDAGGRLNDSGGCQRCGLVWCEWAHGVGTQHRVVRPSPHPDAVRRLLDHIEAEHVPHRTFRDSPPTKWCAACSPTVIWPCVLAELAAEIRG